MKILSVIMCHNTAESTEKIRLELTKYSDSVFVIDSGSEENKRAFDRANTIYKENLYWSGCWNLAGEIFLESDADVLWVIGGDIQLLNKGSDYFECMRSASPFGLWHPVVEGRCVEFMSKKNFDGKDILNVWRLEGIALAVSRGVLLSFYDNNCLIEGNKFGWGVDVWMSWKSRLNGNLNILDNRVSLNHPDFTGYDSSSSFFEMLSWLELKVGTNYRDILHFWSDAPEYNIIEKMEQIK